MKPILSVIVPIYNTEKYLAKCIDSILCQSLSDIEVILINDGSSDNSLAICEEYSSKDNRIVVINQNNSGSIIARKVGIDCANGKYIGFVDSDDYVSDDYFEVMIDAAEKEKSDVCHNNSITYISESNVFKYGMGSYEGVIDNDLKGNILNSHVFNIGKKQILPSLCTKVIKRELISSIFSSLDPHQQLGEDLLCLCDIAYKCKRIVTINGPEYYYCFRKGSIVNSTDNIDCYLSLVKHIKTKILGSGLVEYVNLKFQSFEKFLIAAGINSSNDRIFHLPQYKVGGSQNLNNKKIVLYGAGNVGKDIYEYIIHHTNAEIVGWVDRHQTYSDITYYEISNIHTIEKLEYDYIILCSSHIGHIISMRSELNRMKLPITKIIDEVENVYD